MEKFIPFITLIFLTFFAWYEEGYQAARPYVAATLICMCVISATRELRQ